MRMIEKIKACWRVLKITKKPTFEEWSKISKVTAIGILIIAFIGFIIYLISSYLLI
jgi:protein transport protein SEC61 subunit gamma-like protein